MDTPAAEAVEQDDPFANAGGGDDPFADQPAAAAPEPPVVDKEGQPVEAAVPADAPVPAQETPAPDPDPAPPVPAAEGGDEGKPETDDKPLPRRYHVLYQTAPNQWTEHEWAGDDGEKTKIVLARNNDHALRQAFSLLGEPENGVTVLVVPVSGMKPKRLKRKAVVPRTALDIS